MQLSSSIVTVSDEELSCRLDAIDLLPCVVVSLVISIGRSDWLDDERSPSEMPLGSQSNWLDDEGLTDIHLQYVIKLASNGSMAKE